MTDRPAGFRNVSWDGVTQRSSLTPEAALVRDQLAAAAKAGRWPEVIDLLTEHPWTVNSRRLGGRSGYAPLHQAAWHGADPAVVEQLLDLGAWRTLRTDDDLRAVDIAEQRGHHHLVEVLRPVLVHEVSQETLDGLGQNLYLLICGRVPQLVTEHKLRLPRLEPLTELNPPQMRFPVPGMHGSFNIELRGEELTVRSFNRVHGGWGRTHLITVDSIKLLESDRDSPPYRRR